MMDLNRAPPFWCTQVVLEMEGTTHQETITFSTCLFIATKSMRHKLTLAYGSRENAYIDILCSSGVFDNNRIQEKGFGDMKCFQMS